MLSGALMLKFGLSTEYKTNLHYYKEGTFYTYSTCAYIMSNRDYHTYDIYHWYMDTNGLNCNCVYSNIL